jgi:hypothetical protein
MKIENDTLANKNPQDNLAGDDHTVEKKKGWTARLGQGKPSERKTRITPQGTGSNLHTQTTISTMSTQRLLHTSYELQIQESVMKIANWLDAYKGTFAIT